MMYEFSIFSSRAYLDGSKPEIDPYINWLKATLAPFGFQ